MNTELQLPVAELKQALPGFTKIIAKRTTLTALGCVRVHRDKAGEVFLQTTNLDDFASVKLNTVQSGKPVDLLVPLEPLAKFTKSSGANDNLKLLPGENESVLVYPLGNTYAEQTIATLPREEWPAIPTLDQPPIELDDTFKAALQTAFDCASEDERRMVLNGACLDVSEKNAHYLVATDGRHLFSANSFTFDLEESLIIPSRKFLGWSGFLQDGPWRLRVKAPEKEELPGWIQIESDKWTFITRQIDGKYPNWRLTFPDSSSEKTTVQLSDKAVKFLLTVVPRLPSDVNHQSITLTVGDDGKFLVKGRTSESDNWTSISVEDVQVTGKPTSVSINRHYLIKALKLGLNELQLWLPVTGTLNP